MDSYTAGAGIVFFLLAIFVVLYTILMFLLPFFVYSIRNNLRQTNEKIDRLYTLLAKSGITVKIQPDNTTPSEPPTGLFTLNVDSYLKSYPFSGSNSVTAVKKGEILTVLKDLKGWRYVMYEHDGKEYEGWIDERQLTPGQQET